MKSENSNTTRHVTLRLPRNLRAVWAYPNLLHFEKYTDLLLLSASNERVAYRSTYIQVPYGHVLLNYTFMARRWHIARNTCISFINVLAVAGWLRISRAECRTVSNRPLNAPLISFPKINIEQGFITIARHNDEQNTEHANNYDSDDYNVLTHINTRSDEHTAERKKERNDKRRTEHTAEHTAERTTERTSEQAAASPTATPSTAYEEEQLLTGHQSEHSVDDSDDSSGVGLIIYKKEGKKEGYIKKNKKEKELIPTLEEIQQYCNENALTFVDPQHFYSYYSASDWLDKDGKIIQNWQRLLVQTNQKNKRRKTKPPATSPSSPTTADKLARQNANLARNIAANVASSK